MTKKQEEIRNTIESFRQECYGDDGYGYFTDRLLELLKSQGVVIKKEIAVDDYNHNTTAYDELI